MTAGSYNADHDYWAKNYGDCKSLEEIVQKAWRKSHSCKFTPANPVFRLEAHSVQRVGLEELNLN